MITNVQPLHNAGPADLTFFDNRKYTGQLVTTLAGACILAGVDAGRVPIATATLTTVAPYSAFAHVLCCAVGVSLSSLPQISSVGIVSR